MNLRFHPNLTATNVGFAAVFCNPKLVLDPRPENCHKEQEDLNLCSRLGCLFANNLLGDRAA